MIQVSTFSLIILAIILGAQLMRPSSLLRVARISFFVSIFFILFLAAYYSYQQYFFWKENPVSKFLLPPHKSIGYFISYSFFNFFFQPIFSLAVAVVGFFTAKFLNQKFGEKFFEPVEYYLFALGLLLAGHPGWIYYLIILFSIGIVASFFQKGKFSFYYLWLPAAMLAILIMRSI
jgi:hypothetical protein